MELIAREEHCESRSEITKKIRDILSAGKENISDGEARKAIEEYVLRDAHLSMRSYRENQELINQIFYSLRRDLDILQPFVEDRQISEIMVNGKGHIFVEQSGKLRETNAAFETTEELEETIRRIAARVHKEINELNPIVDARMEDGSRVNAVYKNVALGGPVLTIRKFPEKAIDMKLLIETGSLTDEAAMFLRCLVRAGYNCFISGGTSSGKTTFLNVLSNFVPPRERVILIEDSAELQIKQIKNLVRMECRQANVQNKGEVTMEQLIKTSLRMRPDRIIVGEVRGKEVVSMIQAMNTGHDGSLSTGHGNSVRGMLRRLETMFLQAANFPIDAIRAQIAEGIDIMIHLGRLVDGSRKVLEISEIKPFTGGEVQMNVLFKYRQGVGLSRSKNPLINREKLELSGEALP